MNPLLLELSNWMCLTVKKNDRRIMINFNYLILLGIIGTLLIPVLPLVQPNIELVNDQTTFDYIQPKVSDIPLGWSYKKILNIDPITPEAEFQVKVILTPLNFDYSKVQPDGDDLRFYDTLNNPLSYWIESWNTTESSIVWVKILTGGTSSIYMYYGNPFAVSESDGEATFIFFDDFIGTSLDLSKWTEDNDQYSSSIVSGGVVTVTTDNPDERNGGALIGFNDFYVKKPPAPFNAVLNNSLNLGGSGRGHRILTRANTTASIMVDNALTAYSWDTRDIRWVSDSLVQYNNGTSIITHTNSTCIPDMPLGVRILTHSTFYGPGDGCSGAIRSINTVGQAGRALRTRSYHAFDYDGFTPPSIQVDWVLVRKTVGQEPAVTIVDQTLNLFSPESKTYAGPMSGHYPASYGFEKDNSVPYSDITYSGQPPTGWTVYYPGQYGKLRVLDEYDGHKKVVELRKSRGTYGKSRVGMTKNFVTSATVGTVEFWFNKDSDSGLDATKFKLLGTGGNIEFGIENRALYRGPYTIRTNISTDVFPKDIWLHIRIDFDITQGWQIQLNDTWYGLDYTLPFEGNPSDIYGFDLRSHGTEFDTGNLDHYFYLDAVGYSWDPGYNIGDNLNEGLVLDFNLPEKARVDWKGYYLASEGFEGISEGTTPENWGHWQGGSAQPTTIETKVLDSKADAYGNIHSKVLYCKDNSYGCIYVGDGLWNDVITSGTYEFWVLQQTPGTNWGQSFGLLKDNSPYLFTVRLAEESGIFRYVDGNTSIDTGISFNENKWYRISVDFSEDGTYADLPAHHYRARFYDSNGIDLLYSSPDAEFQYYGNSSGIHVSTGDSVCSNLYFDAFGYSWDPNYDIGDNIHQAVYEGSDPVDLTWQGYSLDSSTNITIEGDTTIVMPDLGEHNIRLYASDSYGIPYRSELRSFQVRTLEIITPENKLYIAPMSGFYPATFGFENDENGAFPKHWEDWSGAHPIDTWIVDEFLGHKKVLRGYDRGTGAVHARNYFNNTEGTIELWMAHTSLSASRPMSIGIFDTFGDPTLLAVEFQGGEILVYTNGTTDVVGLYSVNTWYHVRIDFRSNSSSVPYAGLTPNQYAVFINGIDLGTFAFNAIGDPYYARLYSLYAGTGYEVYFDAIGYSWDPDYDIGDNLNEGLLLSFNTPTELDWAGYSLDGGANATILGNASIRMPSIGSHTIQVFGNDSAGVDFRSELRSFNIALPDPPSISGVDDFSFNFGEPGWSISWTAADPNPANYTVYRNGTSYQEGTWITSIIVTLEELEQGTHNFTCVVQNDFGLQASDEVWITVLPAAPDTTPPTISSPADITFEEGSIGYSILWSGSDNRAPWWATVYRNQTLVYDQAWIGNDIEISLDKPFLIPGIYEYNCTLFDEAGNSVVDIVLVNVFPAVPDTEPPLIIPPDALVYEEGTTGHCLTWECSDAHPYAYKVIKDTTELIFAPWWGENITINVDGLTIGSWIFNLTVWDLSGNSSFGVVNVIVTPQAPDTTSPEISQPAEQIIAENTRGSIIWEVFDGHPSICIISKNGTIVHSQSHWTSGILQYSFASLPLGTWQFTLTLWDEAGNSASSDAIVRVLPGSQADSSAPEISHHPDLEIIFGSVNISVTVYIFDEHPASYTVYLDSLKMAESDWVTPNIQVNILLDGLAIGDYTLKITAWDTFANTATRNIRVTVSGDTTPPDFVSTPLDMSVDQGTSSNVVWQATDTAPSRYEIINLTSGSVIQQGSWGGENIELGLDSLEPGTYYFRCIVYDASENSAMDDVVITVEKAAGGVPGFEFSSLSLLLVVVVIKQLLGKKRRTRK